MTAGGQVVYSRLNWAAAGGLALAGLGLVYVLIPEWNWPAAKLLPSAPRIGLVSSARESAPDAWETRAVRSPSLIALAGGALVSEAAVRRTPAISPPFQVSPGRPSGLGLLAEGTGVKPAVDGGGSLLRQKDISGAGAYAGLLDAPVFLKSPSGGVAVAYLGGLAGKGVELDGWSWAPWTKAGIPWTLTLDLQADAQGRITRVLIDAPAVETQLKESLIQSLYQRGRFQPAGLGQGRVIISYPGVAK